MEKTQRAKKYVAGLGTRGDRARIIDVDRIKHKIQLHSKLRDPCCHIFTTSKTVYQTFTKRLPLPSDATVSGKVFISIGIYNLVKYFYPNVRRVKNGICSGRNKIEQKSSFGLSFELYFKFIFIQIRFPIK